MPTLALGTWQLMGEECSDAVYNAIKIGYRHIDTAQAYGNEEEVGRAISRAIDEGIVSRKDLFIATKLSFENDAGSRVRALVDIQLENLQIDYIDLYYLHSPLRNAALTKDTWDELQKMYSDGIIRAVGVSNFNSNELRELLDTISSSEVSGGGNEEALRLAPMVLQNKYDLYHRGRQLDNIGDDVWATCESLNIRVIGYR